MLRFLWSEDGTCDARIELAFSKTMADARKAWLRGYDPTATVDHSRPTLTYSEFVDNELIHFSNADNIRSIPSVVDGLKTGQRKIMCGCFKRGPRFFTDEVKVAELAGYISEHMAYHHGDAALCGTIVGLSQTFVGSNNIPLLTPQGQFGTRLMGGEDKAGARYIFSKLPRLTRLIFHPDDDAVLTYNEDDGKVVEPKQYVPCLPMVLVNGARGIGTGWSTNVPSFNPTAVANNLRAMLRGGSPEQMVPWSRGFAGKIVPSAGEDPSCPKAYDSFGVVERGADESVHITELPLGTWTQVYKEKVLDGMLAKKKHGLVDVREHHTDTRVSFALSFQSKDCVDKLFENDVHKTLHLATKHSLNNMILFDVNGCIAKYESPEHVLREYFAARGWTCTGSARPISWTSSSAPTRRRTTACGSSGEVIADTIVLKNRKQDDIRNELHAKGYSLCDTPTTPSRAPPPSPRDTTTCSPCPSRRSRPRRFRASKRSSRRSPAELEELRGKTPADMWLADLGAFEVEYEEWLASLEE